MALKLKILGCGTSTGVPLPGCQCAICKSGDPKNFRDKTSAIVTLPSGEDILIDAGSDFRHQALKWDLRKIDAVLLTHSHADHILGLDDLRSFNFISRQPIPIYTNQATADAVRRVFSYVFNQDPDYLGGLLPQLSLHEIPEFCELNLFQTKIQVFPLSHGGTSVLGFRFGQIAYATDCKSIPDPSLEVLRGVKYLVLDGLRYEAHNTHMTIDESIEWSGRIGAEKTYLTHLTHTVDYQETMKRLPEGVELAYDGLEIVCG